MQWGYRGQVRLLRQQGQVELYSRGAECGGVSADDVKGGEILAKGRSGTSLRQGWGMRNVLDFQGDHISTVGDSL